MSPVISKPGVFDDQCFKDVIAGFYATEKVIPKKLMLDYYFLNLNTERRKYNFVAGKENRQSYGFRLFSENLKLNYELEAIYQSGKFNQQSISAFGISADINYRLHSANNLIAGIASNYMSGDKNKKDNRLNTYNLLFSKPQFGLTAPIGATNLVNINPYIKFNPTQKINIYLSSYFMWRQSNQDGTYSPLALEVRSTAALDFTSTKNKIGTLLAFETSYAFNRNLSFALDASYFFAGQYVKATGKGKDIVYLSFKGTYKF